MPGAAGGGDRRGTRTAKSQAPAESYSLILRTRPEICEILRRFAARFMPAHCNAADAARAILEIALCDYERIMGKALGIENYCEAEGMEQDAFRLSVIRAKFPKGRLPKTRIP